MRIGLKRAFAVVGLLGASAIFGPACVHDDSTLVIRGCMAVPKDSCSVTASQTAAMQLGGSVDGLYTQEYYCFAELENQMVPEGNSSTLVTETSRITVYEAEVAVLDTKTGTAWGTFSTPTWGFLDPTADQASPGFGVARVTLIDAGIMAKLTKLALGTAPGNGTIMEVVAAFIVRGKTTGGVVVESNELRYPIAVCAGCLCSQPPNQYCFPNTNTPATDCLFGQDGPADCRFLAPGPYLECKKAPDGTVSASCPAIQGWPDGSCL